MTDEPARKPWEHNPGSDEAKDQGCKCPVIDNAYGRGRGDGTFWITQGCPLHDGRKGIFG